MIEHTVLSVVIGSHAYGLDTDESDVDRRGVYVPPTRLFWAFEKPPTSVDGPEQERVSWEVEHFLSLALKANPTVLEVLASDLVETCTPLGAELQALLPALLSQRAADSYRRATAQQFARAAAAMASGGTPRWKQVMHVIRLLTLCDRLLSTGELVLRVGEHRAQLLAVRDGDVPWKDVVKWVEDLRDRTARAVLRSPLPAVPDTAAVQDWLVSVRRRSALEDQ
ncbi:nucleotidyltransferase domain-containing protein [Kutzneria sp. NPDC051319]|uniref:nucleotidyltransferase domain-containing protein n=1 Tax=Kutzneria sp. NPDC051319 TaxID=3155047 RepID=UPI00343D2852